MNHPKREEWVSYLYDEATPEVQRRVRTHFAECAECRQEFEAWKNSLNQLDAWELPRLRNPAESFAPFLRWAAAAALVLVIGFMAGGVAASHADVSKLRSAIEPQIRQDLRQEMAQLISTEINRASTATLAAAGEQADRIASTYAAALEVKQAKDAQAVKASLLSLKSQLDTVAINTDVGFRQAERHLVQLAGYQPSNSSPEPPQN